MSIFGQAMFSLNRVRGLYRRYRHRHYQSRTRGFSVVSPSGETVLQVTEIAETTSSTWIRAVGSHTVTFRLCPGEEAPPLRGRMQSADIPAANATDHIQTISYPQDQTTGFIPVSLSISANGKPGFSVPLPRVPAWQRHIAGIACSFGFAAALATSVPAGVRWMRRKSAADKQLIKEVLGLAPEDNALPLDDRMFSPGPDLSRRRRTTTGVLVILPVYNAFPLLKETILRLKKHTSCPWHLILIEDCSTDPEIRPWLHDMARNDGRVTLLENAENLGFVASVNRGFAEAKSHPGPLLILNADAFLPPDWNARLLQPFADPRVASVTPLSNDAEIMSVPVSCVRCDLKPGEADRLDAILSEKFNCDARGVTTALAKLPTGVGFCMALSADWLAKAGGFDPLFSPGYGEEVDWCQKVRALGGKHIGIGNLFVEHRGAGSFGRAEKPRLVSENSAKISKRYPRYDQDVQDFITSDPLISARLQAGLGLAAIRAADHPDPDQRALQIWVGHSLGGGADQWLSDQIRRAVAGGRDVVVLRVGSAAALWRVELHCAEGITAGRTNNDATLCALLDLPGRRHVHCSNGVGHPDPPAFCALLRALSSSSENRLTLYCHDHYMISPSYTLLNSTGRFEGIPQENTCDPAHVFETAAGPVSLAEWRNMWGTVLNCADKVVCFSENTRGFLTSTYPDLNASQGTKTAVRPHGLLTPVPKLKIPVTPDTRSVTIAVPGNINGPKGAHVIADLARRQSTSNIRFIVIGNVAPEIPIPGTLKVHGTYHVAELPHLVERYKVNAWLIPAVAPETFSYTTHEALATGMPVFGFAIGAQGDAIHVAGNGYILDDGPDKPEAILAVMQRVLG